MVGNPRRSRSDDAIRGVLLCGSAVFAVSSLALLAAPATFAQLLGLEASDSVTWTLRMVGACLAALCGQMFLVRSAPDPQVRAAAGVMLVGGGLMTVLTLVVPGPWTILRWAYLAFGATFMTFYAILLLLGRARRAPHAAGEPPDSETEAFR